MATKDSAVTASGDAPSLAAASRSTEVFHLDEEELDTIIKCLENRQPGRITTFEINELVRVYRSRLNHAAAVEASGAEVEPSEAEGLIATAFMHGWRRCEVLEGDDRRLTYEAFTYASNVMRERLLPAAAVERALREDVINNIRAQTIEECARAIEAHADEGYHGKRTTTGARLHQAAEIIRSLLPDKEGG
jgi:hypothetical protein